MSSASNADVVNLFKRVYGDLVQLLPEDYPLKKIFPSMKSKRSASPILRPFA